MVLSLILEWMGYRNLAFSGRRIIMVSFVTLVVFMGIAKIFTDLFDAIDEENYSWCRRLHKALGAENKKIPGLIWLRSLASIVIWGGFAVVIINTLDYSGGIMVQVRSYVINGFPNRSRACFMGVATLWADHHSFQLGSLTPGK